MKLTDTHSKKPVSGGPSQASCFRRTQYTVLTGAPGVDSIKRFVWFAWSQKANFPGNTCFAGWVNCLAPEAHQLRNTDRIETRAWLPTLKWPCVKSYLIGGWISTSVRGGSLAQGGGGNSSPFHWFKHTDDQTPHPGYPAAVQLITSRTFSCLTTICQSSAFTPASQLHSFFRTILESLLQSFPGLSQTILFRIISLTSTLQSF